MECGAAELEMASGDMPRFPGKGYVALPEDTAEKAKEWAEDEAEREAAMKKISAFAKNLGIALEGMG